MFNWIRFTVLPLLAWGSVVAATGPAVHHDMAISIAPHSGRIEVVDRVRLASAKLAAAGFWLNAALSPVAPDGRALEPVEVGGDSVPMRRFIPGDGLEFTVRYAGSIEQRPPPGVSASTWAGFARGHIGPQGVFLTATSGWYPQFADAPVTFDLSVTLPDGWLAVSQGRRELDAAAGTPAISRWREESSQQEIVLVANQFTRFARDGAVAQAEAYLRSPDQALAERYLAATGEYLELYSRLIGEYPYAKFALVENFWETGYGMPSFTMLGPRVVRLPFILHTSYPHEILHSWWGNGVYVDHARGNWSEGLTAYLADHLVQESRGLGADYRRAALAKYRDWVDDRRDFSLREFRGKHGAVSEAVGYNKTLMFFHMLRTRLGDDAFVAGLRRFYAAHRFEAADWRDLRAAFEAASGLALHDEFEQWIGRTGAPRLVVEGLEVTADGDGFRLNGKLRQTQEGDPYRLEVPIAIALDGVDLARRASVVMDGPVTEFELALPSRPRRFAVDPEFDLFRRLDPAESPTGLSALFGARDSLAVLAAGAPAGLKRAYSALAERLGATDLREDLDPARLRRARAIWILGWDNPHREVIERLLSAHGVTFEAGAVHIGATVHRREDGCVVLVARAPAPTGWIGCDAKAAFEVFARKLPHYGKYGYLAFAGAQLNNVAKGNWTVLDSPLNVALDAQAAGLGLRLPPRPALTP